MRSRRVAAALVGSCSSSISRFIRLADEEEEVRRAEAAGLLAGAFVVTGGAEVDGDGSKPVGKKNKKEAGGT